VFFIKKAQTKTSPELVFNKKHKQNLTHPPELVKTSTINTSPEFVCQKHIKKNLSPELGMVPIKVNSCAIKLAREKLMLSVCNKSP
jgi:hypothetical protein